MNKTIFLIVLISLIGCTSDPITSPKVTWISSKKTDEFSDKQTCIATVGSVYTSFGAYTETGKLYPFIQNLDGKIIVGVKSGGNINMPVGDIQLRIDNNQTWEISTSETPANSDNLPGYMKGTSLPTSVYTQNLPEDQKEVIENAYKASIAQTTKLMSPYTGATGEKAKSIINEMLNGKTLIYRTMGFMGTPSNTGQYTLDTSLAKAMSECEIKM
jgi:hypothetical protein